MVYICSIWFDLLAYQPLIGYFIPNPVYVYISNICKHISYSLTFLDKPELTCLHTVILRAILANTS